MEQIKAFLSKIIFHYPDQPQVGDMEITLYGWQLVVIAAVVLALFIIIIPIIARAAKKKKELKNTVANVAVNHKTVSPTAISKKSIEAKPEINDDGLASVETVVNSIESNKKSEPIKDSVAADTFDVKLSEDELDIDFDIDDFDINTQDAKAESAVAASNNDSIADSSPKSNDNFIDPALNPANFAPAEPIPDKAPEGLDFVIGVPQFKPTNTDSISNELEEMYKEKMYHEKLAEERKAKFYNENGDKENAPNDVQEELLNDMACIEDTSSNNSDIQNENLALAQATKSSEFDEGKVDEENAEVDNNEMIDEQEGNLSDEDVGIDEVVADSISKTTDTDKMVKLADSTKGNDHIDAIPDTVANISGVDKVVNKASKKSSVTIIDVVPKKNTKNKNVASKKLTAEVQKDSGAKASATLDIDNVKPLSGGTIKVVKIENGRLVYKLYNPSNLVIYTSSDYANLSGVKSAINTFRKNVDLGVFSVAADTDDKMYRFTLKKGATIYVGEPYKTRKAAENNAVAVKKYAKDASLVILY